MKHLFIFLTLLTCTYSNFIINPYVIAPSGSAELPTANLVAHYQPSGISRHGLDTVSGTASISDSAPKFGTGALVNVNGVDHIQEGVSSDWDHGTNDWTYETWVKNSLTEANRPMFANMTGGTMNASNIAVAIRVSSETIHAEVSDGVTLTTMTNGSTGWNDNAWHHFAFVRQGTTLRFYLDGIELSNSTSYTASLNSGKKMTWGSNEDGTSGVTQRFDEMRISSICRYPDGTTFTLATEAFTADSDTLYLNHCDGTNTGTRFYDSALSTGAFSLWVDDSGNEHDMLQTTGTNQALGTPNALDGLTGATFDGSNDFYEIPDNSDMDQTGNITIVMVFKSSDSSGFIFTNSHGGSFFASTFQTAISGSKGFFRRGQVASEWDVTGVTSLDDNVYRAVSFIDNGTSMEILLNNVTDVDSTPAGYGTPTVNANPIDMGRRAGNDDVYWSGVLVEVFMYDANLSASIRTQLNNYIQAKYPSIP